MLWHLQAVSHNDTALTSWSVFQAQLQEWQTSRTEHAQSSSIIFHCWLKQCKRFLYRTEQQSVCHLSETKVKWRERFCVEWEEGAAPLLSLQKQHAPQTKPSPSANMMAGYGLIHFPTDTYFCTLKKHFHIFFKNMDIIISIYGIMECIQEIEPLKHCVGGERVN